MRILVLMGLITPAAAWGATLDVCTTCTYTQVQAAVNAAAPGDTVRIAAGRWSAPLVLRGVRVHLVGAGAGATVLTAPSGIVLTVESAQVEVEALAIEGGNNRGIEVRSSGLTLRGVEVREGTGSGGGLWGAASSITIEDAVFAENRAPTGAGGGSGGHIYLESGADLILRNTTLRGGAALRGGAIALRGASAELHDCTFSQNMVLGTGGFLATYGYGGALYGQDASLVLSGVRLEEDWAETGEGGAIALFDSSFSGEDVEISGSRASRSGGGIYLSGGWFEASALRVLDTEAVRQGCAIYVGDDAGMELTGSRFADTRSTGAWTAAGGAIFMEQGGFSISDTVFERSQSSLDGGALYLLDLDWAELARVRFEGQRATRDGGAIFIGGTTALALEQAEFAENRAEGRGGAIRWAASSSRSGGLFAEGGGFLGNSAGTYGGAISVNTGVQLELTDLAFTENAAEFGGALSIFGVSGVELARAVFCGNRADDEGGAVRLASSGTSWMNLYNNVFALNRSEGDGGGLWTDADSGNYALQNNDFLGNAAERGAGLFAEANLGFVNNLVAWNEGTAVHTENRIDLTYSDFWENPGGNLSGRARMRDGVFYEDPRLAAWTGDCATLDAHPTLGSPLIDRGNPALRDPNGSVSDVGAYGGPSADPALYLDADGDGYTALFDCDDADPRVHPGAAETWYDGLDQNCDGADDFDADRDGFARGLDCDDTDASVHPGVAEVWYDGVDQDCDGADDFDADGDGDAPLGHGGGDCDDTDADVFLGATEVWYDGVDQDCDGHSDYDADADGHDSAAWRGDDCDDTDPAAFPGAPETCDGFDNDCDGLVDDNPVLTITFYRDTDGDGYGEAGSTVSGCILPEGYARVAGDCAPSDPAVSPAAEEVCDGVDNNCDGARDEAGALGGAPWYFDSDGDGFGGGEAVSQCEPPGPGWTPSADDCDDTDGSVFPGGLEVCDGADNDCNGVVDDAPSGGLLWFPDGDGDGFGGDDGDPVESCAAVEGYAANRDDCDNQDSSVYPGAAEVCDDRDQDCDGVADNDAIDATLWFIDGDADGYGAEEVYSCTPTDSLVALGGDCDDANPEVSPGAAEICDGRDQDCDGDLDEDAVDAHLWYADADQDGWGADGEGVASCAALEGYAFLAGDCDDGNPAFHPEAAESCEEPLQDFNCDGSVGDADADGDGVIACEDCDDADATVFPGAGETWYDGRDQNCDGSSDFDQDSDGWDAAEWWGEDCLDTDAGVNPEAEEVWYDGLDQDCDGGSDFDQDGDGFAAPSGQGEDCDDTVATVFPGASEVEDDGVDQDCDGEDALSPLDQDEAVGVKGGCACNGGAGVEFGGLLSFGLAFFWRRRRALSAVRG